MPSLVEILDITGIAIAVITLVVMVRRNKTDKKKKELDELK